ncbi:Oidioi.mRNA.OKI2018_I69.XSR.g16059.t1.cds [Oikopleura dioica]|uniref:Oidioi.mRNA.OKI2018_I69.XSR.g16059.t1.cds n=1 Tax=Oikopleura dioica TaxID=34765 RepID=A0ABN7SJ40_OIKDI|nr:Oidioi.mRNA.OKI2018_I69.XSR.g16059.t1.cds [Oikopleura dioica]
MNEIEAISKEFVHSGEACGSCGGFTKVHAKIKAKKTGATKWKCVKCIFASSSQVEAFGQNLIENPLQVTNGKFKCPAKKCSSILTFDEFMKKDCCGGSRKHSRIFADYLEMKEKFGALQEEYQRAMKNSIEKKKASEDADIYRDAIGVSMIATANKFADFLKANDHIVRESQCEFDKEHVNLLEIYRQFQSKD